MYYTTNTAKKMSNIIRMVTQVILDLGPLTGTPTNTTNQQRSQTRYLWENPPTRRWVVNSPVPQRLGGCLLPGLWVSPPRGLRAQTITEKLGGLQQPAMDLGRQGPAPSGDWTEILTSSFVHRSWDAGPVWPGRWAECRFAWFRTQTTSVTSPGACSVLCLDREANSQPQPLSVELGDLHSPPCDPAHSSTGRPSGRPCLWREPGQWLGHRAM